MDNKRPTSTGSTTRKTNWQAFFSGFLRHPQEVGSVIPSSRFLEQRIMDAADLTDARLVVELGPGTGGTTQAILDRLPQSAKLLTIDMSSEFIDLLDENISDPRLSNHCGSAADLSRILKEHDLSAPDAVISGIPFSTMPKEVGANVVKAVREELSVDGRFVAYQFKGEVATITRPFMGEPVYSTEWRNVPPMRVYCWRKAATNDPASD